MRTAWTKLVLCVWLTAPVSAASAADVYRVGNSLTWDSQPNAIAQIAKARGYKHVVGYHIKCGSSLSSIWANPAEVCVKAPLGTFAKALPGRKWDAVAIQPHPGRESTLKADTDRILDFIKLTRQNKANAKTVFYIYSAWPSRKLGPYEKVWTQAVPDKDATRTVHARQYTQHLLKRVRARLGGDGPSVYVIPAGEVLFRLDELMRAGKVEGYTSAHDLYRDDVHLTHELGRYVAGLTVFATLYGEVPKGLVKPKGTYRKAGKDWPLPKPLRDAVHRVVWEVVTKNSDARSIAGK